MPQFPVHSYGAGQFAQWFITVEDNDLQNSIKAFPQKDLYLNGSSL